jgi:membrane-bound metal-dependent hydrolase YbcI (DUF457 family)
MSKYKLTILIAVLFTIPLVGYFTVNGYWWLYDGNNPDENKMFVSFIGGIIAGLANVMMYLTESEQL